MKLLENVTGRLWTSFKIAWLLVVYTQHQANLRWISRSSSSSNSNSSRVKSLELGRRLQRVGVTLHQVGREKGGCWQAPLKGCTEVKRQAEIWRSVRPPGQSFWDA
ncbi:hypothetical protein M0804_004122 [Polistes exclamans]|nr:hypothetical protein M0804_004122 [Polistes exclamans]